MSYWQEISQNRRIRDDGAEVQQIGPCSWRGFFEECQTLRYQTVAEAIEATDKMFPRKPARPPMFGQVSERF